MKLEMNAFNDVLQVPVIFEVVESSQAAFERILAIWPYLRTQKHKVLLLCGAGGATRAIAEVYAGFLREELDRHVRVHEIGSASLKESRSLDAVCARDGITLLVAVGGGKVIDTAKMVVSQRKIALLCIPSALSSDGITSPVSVLRGDDGRIRSFASGIPAGVLVDLSVTTRAPVELTLAGVGDVLSNVSALLDVEDYESAGLGQVNGFAKLLSHSACQMVLPLTKAELALPEAHETIARALILSGLSMAFSGNSLPCSGGEHLISHAIDHLGVGTGGHGTQVAMTTLYCLSLRQILGRHAGLSDVRGTMINVGLPMSPGEMGISRSEFLEAIRIAPRMRPGRYSLLQPALNGDVLDQAYDRAFCGEC